MSAFPIDTVSVYNLSDEELLKNLYTLKGYNVHSFVYNGIITIQKGEKVTTAEFCANDIMSIAFEHKVGVVPCGYKEMWKARDVEAKFEVWAKCPIRALCMCLVLLLQHNNDLCVVG